MPGPTFISGDSVDLCAVDEEDVEFLQRTVNSPAVWSNIGARKPLTEKQEREWYEERASADNGSVDFVIAVDGDAVGSVGLEGVDDPNGSVEIGIFVAEEHWGEGYGTEAAELVTDYAFDQHRRHRVVARVFEFNDASAAVWEKLGFELEGTHRDEMYLDGDYHDVRYYGVLEDEWRAE
ncbi:GNAT family N-acetyltransferase [Halobacterium litoreum]|uniref:GNAT family N-acetyltransferase n=1 Tax=Halobacterium litoreum TaxID=2039234 RepID=A0ABD5NDX9_9EURY|nr:GNAT family protein [Halobacterium litoreum]UHH13607.1 GNAT family N-acetyltransferase [Halobacterium litoreum]